MENTTDRYSTNALILNIHNIFRFNSHQGPDNPVRLSVVFESDSEDEDQVGLPTIN